MADHDQRFKVLLQEFFAEFCQLFFPDWAARFDFTHLAWLDKEVFTDPPQGDRRDLDLVARLPTRQAVLLPRGEPAASWIALVHAFEALLNQDTHQGVRTMATTYYERGLQEGLLQGQRHAVQIQLEARFGPLSPTARRRLESLPAEHLNQLLLAVLTAQSLQELGLEA